MTSTFNVPERPTLLTRKIRRLAPLLRNARDAHNLKVAAIKLEQARAVFGEARPIVSLTRFAIARDMYNRFAKVPATDDDATTE